MFRLDRYDTSQLEKLWAALGLPAISDRLLRLAAAGAGPCDVKFSWEDGRDIETVTAALSYQLRVGTSAGAHDVCPGLLLPDGQRSVPRRGYVQPAAVGRNRSKLRLPMGTYHWTVP